MTYRNIESTKIKEAVGEPLSISIVLKGERGEKTIKLSRSY
jgi:hypothetical protein